MCKNFTEFALVIARFVIILCFYSVFQFSVVEKAKCKLTRIRDFPYWYVSGNRYNYLRLLTVFGYNLGRFGISAKYLKRNFNNPAMQISYGRSMIAFCAILDLHKISSTTQTEHPVTFFNPSQIDLVLNAPWKPYKTFILERQVATSYLLSDFADSAFNNVISNSYSTLNLD